jgi:hypothetical protein
VPIRNSKTLPGPEFILIVIDPTIENKSLDNVLEVLKQAPNRVEKTEPT